MGPSIPTALGDLHRWRPPLATSSPDRLARIAAEAWHRIDVGGLLTLARFDSVRYDRRTLALDDWEIALVGWLPGQDTPAHDHATSAGITLVLAGRLEETRFDVRDGLARPRSCDTLGPGESALEHVGTVHRVRNRGEDRAISLHLYAPPLVAMRSWATLDPLNR